MTVTVVAASVDPDVTLAICGLEDVKLDDVELDVDAEFDDVELDVDADAEEGVWQMVP